MKKVSIIVPVYNTAEYLPKCIESIINQSYSNLELILVDDGSTDESPTICDEYAKKDSRIKVIHKTNGGVSSARNCGLDKATADYITFVDSDDFILDSFSEFCKKLDHQDLVVSCKAEMPKKIMKKIKNLKESDIIIDFLLKNSVTIETNSVCYKIFNKYIIQDLRFNEKVTIAEDMDFVLRALLQSKKIEIIPIHYYNYSQRETSVMHDNSYHGIKKVVDSGKELINYYGEKFNGGKWHRKIIALISENVMSGILVKYKGCNQKDRNKAFGLVSQNINLLGYAEKFSKKIFYIFMKMFGIKFALKMYCIIKK